MVQLPDNVARIDLNCPDAPQVVVIGEGIARRKDSPSRLTLKAATTLRCMHTHAQIKPQM